MKNVCGVIYGIKCYATGKMYVGQAKKLKKRIFDHKYYKYDGCIKLSNAVRAHGWHNFYYGIIRECYSKDEMNVFETYYQLKYDTVENGYNAILGQPVGYGQKPTLGMKWSEERKEKMRKRMTGVNNPFYGKKHSEEIIQMIKQKLTGKPSKLKGRPKSEEHRKKLAIIRSKIKHKPCSEETKKKISEKQKGKVLPEKQKSKISKTLSNIYHLFNTITNETVIVDYGLNKFAKERGLSKCQVYKLSNKKIKSYKGWIIISIVEKNCHTKSKSKLNTEGNKT